MKCFVPLFAIIALAACAPITDLAKVFDLVDTDKDGIITKKEYDALGSRFDDDGNGEIETDEFMKHWMTGTGMDNKESVLVLFSIDQNDDQILQRNELDTEFGYIDTNNDNSVSMDEFKALMANLGRTLAAAKAAEPKVTGIFNRADADADSFLTRDEFKTVLSKADVNADGMVSEDEFIAAWTKVTGTTTARAGFMFDIIDSDQDGFYDDGEDDLVFDEFDHNDDGKVARLEFEYSMIWIFVEINKAQAAAAAAIGF